MIDNYVTGASGFIGNRLLSELSGETVAIPYTWITRKEFQDFRRFFFLSAYGNMANHAHSYSQILQANVLDLGCALKALYGFTFESFVYVSSSSVNLPVQTTYSRTKRAGEEMVQAMPIPGCIVRPFSVTGVGEQERHLIPTLIRSCLERTQTYFVPNATHDFVDIADVVDGLIKLADQRAVGVYEFGRGTAFSNQEVLHLVEEACGAKANIHIADQARDYDNLEWVCRDFTAREYGWEPKKSLADSIGEMVEAYKSSR